MKIFNEFPLAKYAVSRYDQMIDNSFAYLSVTVHVSDFPEWTETDELDREVKSVYNFFNEFSFSCFIEISDN